MKNVFKEMRFLNFYSTKTFIVICKKKRLLRFLKLLLRLLAKNINM